jgi:hypothetical protein
MDKEFVQKISEAMKIGLEEFFADFCFTEIVMFTYNCHPHDSFCSGDIFNRIDVTVDHSVRPVIPALSHYRKGKEDPSAEAICSIYMLEDHCVVSSLVDLPTEQHEYCHPQFPNSVLHALGRQLKRDERFERVKTEAVEIADQDPAEALTYFLKECQQDPLLSRFINANFALVLAMQMSDDRHYKAKVVEWLENWKLPEIVELCG